MAGECAGGQRRLKTKGEVSWDEVEKVLFGCLGYTPEVVGWMTLREIDNAISGYTLKTQLEQRSLWEASRLVAYCAVKPHVKGNLKPQDIVKFEWEKAEKIDTENVREKGKRLAQKWRVKGRG